MTTETRTDRNKVIQAFDGWRRPNLIRTANGITIYFEGVINGCPASFIDYQSIIKTARQ